MENRFSSSSALFRDVGAVKAVRPCLETPPLSALWGPAVGTAAAAAAGSQPSPHPRARPQRGGFPPAQDIAAQSSALCEQKSYVCLCPLAREGPVRSPPRTTCSFVVSEDKLLMTLLRRDSGPVCRDPIADPASDQRRFPGCGGGSERQHHGSLLPGTAPSAARPALLPLTLADPGCRGGIQL